MAKCTLCGESMPAGEEMFKYHGYSGDCPKPPLARIETKMVVEYALRRERDGEWFIGVTCDSVPQQGLGPFADEGEARAAYDDLLAMMRSTGAIDTVQQ